MGYLERNQRLLAEVATCMSLKRGIVLNDDFANSRFTALGSYNSSEIGNNIYLGLKEFKNADKNRNDIAKRMVGELVVMQVILEGLPHLLPELPVLHGLLVGQRGEPIGIVTEDFSQGAVKKVEPERGNYHDLEKLLERGSEKMIIDTGYMAFKVDSQRRLGDFWVACPYSERHWNLLEQLEKEIPKYTVKINYLL